jgi:ferredoxin
MDIQFNKQINSPECILCLRCMTEACHYDAISIHCAGLPLTLAPRKTQKQTHNTSTVPYTEVDL